MATATRRNAATAKDAAKKRTAAPAAPEQPTPAPTPAPEVKPATPQARPLFTDTDGKTVQGTMAVYQVLDRYELESGELAGLPRRVEFIGTFPTTSHTAAVSAARAAGVLPGDADAVTLNARFVSAVDVPVEQPVEGAAS